MANPLLHHQVVAHHQNHSQISVKWIWYIKVYMINLKHPRILLFRLHGYEKKQSSSEKNATGSGSNCKTPTISYHIKFHFISNHQELLKCPWMTPQILLKLKPKDALTSKILSWKFQLHSSYGSKIITLNFAKNSPKLPSVSCKQDFPNFGLMYEKSNHNEIWTPCSLQLK